MNAASNFKAAANTRKRTASYVMAAATGSWPSSAESDAARRQ
eukprot:SAG22_NODE_718_length_7670_cov_11.194690_2_plen_42_part_00